MTVRFIDLEAQMQRIRPQIDASISRVLDEGNFISGAQVAQFEQQLADFAGVPHVVGCANGTDALQIALMAMSIGPGDGVFCPSFTFAATAEAVALVGATPIFVDVDQRSFNLDPASLERALDNMDLVASGVRPVGVIAVDLFGLAADYDGIGAVAEKHGLWVMSDSAQGLGCTYKGRPGASVCEITTTSFFPAKPLGCYGDGGALLTTRQDLAELFESLRVHGKGAHKYANDRIGLNSRLDTIQAAILMEKLAIFDSELDARDAVARRYDAGLADIFTTPLTPGNDRCTWAQYTLVAPDDVDREVLLGALSDRGVPTAVYYPKPLHRQSAYAAYPSDPAGLATSETLSGKVFSLPMHPYLAADSQDWIVEQVREALAEIR